MKKYSGLERLIVSFTANCVAGIALYVILQGVGLSIIISALLSVSILIIGTLFLSKRLPILFDGLTRRHPWICLIWLIVSIVSVLQIARISVFMLDHSQAEYSLFPGDSWMVEHCCLTAYSESARFTEEEEINIYDPEFYANRKVAGFNVDLYHYPPMFLLLPLSLRGVIEGDFLELRKIWFGISLLTILIAIALVIYRLEPGRQLYALGMAPLIFCSMPMLAGLQMSNAQIIIIAISMIAFVLIPRQTVAGGLLLAMSSVAKIFPGILFLYLLVQKKWRAVVWTIAAVIFLSLLTLIIIGPNVFKLFIEYELPRLSNGEAFSRPFSKLFAVARNMSPFGIPLKLGHLGVPDMTMEVGRIISVCYSLGILFLVFRAGRYKPRSHTEAASIWLSLLCLGTLISPFAPANYILISLVWLVSINRELFSPLSAISIWLLISFPFFISREAPFLIQVISYLPAQILAMGVPAFMLWHAGTQPYEALNENGIIDQTIKQRA